MVTFWIRLKPKNVATSENNTFYHDQHLNWIFSHGQLFFLLSKLEMMSLSKIGSIETVQLSDKN